MLDGCRIQSNTAFAMCKGNPANITLILLAHHGYHDAYGAELIRVPSADCCDGSDEAPGLCKNTCAEAGSANRAALKARAAAFKHGLKAKERYVRDAVSSRQKWEAELKRTEQEEAELKKAVGKLQSTGHST